MNLTNFSFNEDLIALDIKGQYLDLHNNYDFSMYGQKQDTVTLYWVLAEGDWMPEGLPEKIIIEIKAVTFFEVRGDLKARSDLNELGFFENSGFGKVDYNGSNVPEQHANLLVFRFVGGSELVVSGGEATCFLEKNV